MRRKVALACAFYLGCSLDGCIAGPSNDRSYLTEHAPLVATHHALPPPPQGGNARPVKGPIAELVAEAMAAARNDLQVSPPTTHGNGMVQVSARVLKRQFGRESSCPYP